MILSRFTESLEAVFGGRPELEPVRKLVYSERDSTSESEKHLQDVGKGELVTVRDARERVAS